MAAKEIKTLLDLLRWYKNTPKQIPGSEIDYCLSLGWKLGQEAAMKEMEKKFTGAQHTQLAICVLAKSFPVSCEHLVDKKWCGFHMECPHKQQASA